MTQCDSATIRRGCLPNQPGDYFKCHQSLFFSNTHESDSDWLGFNSSVNFRNQNSAQNWLVSATFRCAIAVQWRAHFSKTGLVGLKRADYHQFHRTRLLHDLRRRSHHSLPDSGTTIRRQLRACRNSQSNGPGSGAIDYESSQAAKMDHESGRRREPDQRC